MQTKKSVYSVFTIRGHPFITSALEGGGGIGKADEVREVA